MISHRTAGELCRLLLILLVVSIPTTTQAQVQIKERVSIVPAPAVQNTIASGATEAEIVAPFTGTLKVKINYVDQLNSPIPPDAYFNIRLRGMDHTISVAQYTGYTEALSGLAHDYCNLLWAIPVTEFVRSFQQNVDSLYRLPGIVLGDTLLFSYHGNEAAGGEAATETDSTWDVHLSLRDPCLRSTVFPYGAANRIWCWLTVEIDPVVDMHCISIVLSPDHLAPGDTSVIVLNKLLDDGSTTPFPAEQRFDLSIESGTDYGVLVDPSSQSAGQSLAGVRQPVLFVATRSIDADSVAVQISVFESDGGASASRRSASQGAPVAAAGPTQKTSTQPSEKAARSNALQQMSGALGACSNIAQVNIIHEHTIMLGETKYYQAVYSDDGARLIIREHPGVGPGISEDIWGDSPVRGINPVLVPAVYWEKRKPTGEQLLPGLIRLVGRFLNTKDASSYSVRLTATTRNGITGSLDIKVTRPVHLGATGYRGTDVRGSTFDLDSLVIGLSGETGILPQYLKAMVAQETQHKFAASYRYEPFTDMRIQARAGSRFKNSIYTIKSESELGDPRAPTDHRYVYVAWGKLDGYPGFQKIWDFYQEHPRVYSVSVYDSQFTPTWAKFWIQAKEELEEKGVADPTEQVLNDSADARFYRHMRFEWKGGMENKIAQTRIAASYGFLQLMYTSAVLSPVDYPAEDAAHRPEDLNELAAGFHFGARHFLGNLRDAARGGFDISNWSIGLEAVYAKALKLYNGSSDYAKTVGDSASSYLPR
jgi:hypothetical protein